MPGSAYYVTAIEREGDQGLWVLASGQVWKFSGSAWTRTEKNGTSLLKLPDGTLVVCARDSLQRYRNGAWAGAPFQFSAQYGRSFKSSLAMPGDRDAVRSLSYDRSGTLWAGTFGRLAAYASGTWTILEIPTIALPSNSIQALASFGGQMWIGTENALAHFENGLWRTHNVRVLPEETYLSVTSLAVEGSTGSGPSIWGVAAGEGLFRYIPAYTPMSMDSAGESGTWTWYSRGPTTLPEGIHNVVPGSLGTVWAAGATGLFRYTSESWQKVPDPASGFPEGVKSLAYDGKGSLWVGSPQSLLRFDGAAWHAERDSGQMDLVFDSEGRLWGQGKTGFHWLEAGQWHKRPFRPLWEYGLNTVRGLAADQDGRVVFQHVVCGPGLCSSFGPPPTEIGFVTPDTLVIADVCLPNRPATSIAVDDHGWPWIGTGRGLVHGYQNFDLGIAVRGYRPVTGRKAALLFPGRRSNPGPTGVLHDLQGRATVGRDAGVRIRLKPSSPAGTP